MLILLPILLAALTPHTYADDAPGRLIAAGEQTTDGLATVHYFYEGVRRIQEVVDPSSPTGTGTTRGEYVYGPDYVDEFVLQSYSLGSGQGDRQAKMYMLQDANYNVMALVNDTGGVLEQYQWDPYGTLVSKQTTASPAPVNRVGHQGLFFYRFDGRTGGPFTTSRATSICVPVRIPPRTATTSPRGDSMASVRPR